MPAVKRLFATTRSAAAMPRSSRRSSGRLYPVHRRGAAAVRCQQQVRVVAEVQDRDPCQSLDHRNDVGHDIAEHDVWLVRGSAHMPSRITRSRNGHRRSQSACDARRQTRPLITERYLMLGELGKLHRILAVRDVQGDPVPAPLQGDRGIGYEPLAAAYSHAGTQEGD